MNPVIDAHAHLVPSGLIAEVRRSAALAEIEVADLGDGNSALALPGLVELRPIPPRVLSRTAAHAWMDEQGIDCQVSGTWSDLFGYRLPDRLGADFVHLMNELLLAETAHDTRIVPLMSLPMQNTELAIRELQWACAQGCAGVTIGPSAGADELDADRLEPFWSAVSEASLPVVLHPMFSNNGGRTEGYGLPNTVGRPHDTDIAVCRLLYSERLHRNPRIRMLLVHGGGSLPYLWGRVLRNRDIGDPAWGAPQEAKRCLYFDTVVYRAQALRFLMDFAGDERVLLGSDYPFPIMDPRPLDVVRAAELESSTLDRICSRNALSLFGHSHFTANHQSKGAQ